MLLLTSGTTFFFAASVAAPLTLPDAAGVNFSLNGCAADVDVAAGGVCVDEDELAETGVAFESLDEVVRNRGDENRGANGALEAARKQLRQIMVGVLWGWQLNVVVTRFKSLAWVEVMYPICFSGPKMRANGAAEEGGSRAVVTRPEWDG